LFVRTNKDSLFAQLFRELFRELFVRTNKSRLFVRTNKDSLFAQLFRELFRELFVRTNKSHLFVRTNKGILCLNACLCEQTKDEPIKGLVDKGLGLSRSQSVQSVAGGFARLVSDRLVIE